VVGTRIDCGEMGRARRFEGATRGGGMREEEDAGFEGGAMRVGLRGGGMDIDGAGPEALCAEFIAGKDGGGRLSSSSSSSSESCSLSVNEGIAGASSILFAVAFGVVCGEGTGETVSSFSLLG
jgi:hypothetical protein